MEGVGKEDREKSSVEPCGNSLQGGPTSVLASRSDQQLFLTDRSVHEKGGIPVLKNNIDAEVTLLINEQVILMFQFSKNMLISCH